MSKHKRATVLAIGGFVLESGAAIALWFCYLLHDTPYFALALTLLVLSGCLFSLGVVAFLYASLAIGDGTSSTTADRAIGT